MLDQDAYKAILTDFVLSKWSREVDKLMFFSISREGLASVVA